MDTTAIRRAGTPLDRGVAIMREAAKNMAGEYMLPQRTEEGAPDLYGFLDVPSGIERRLKAAFKPFMLPWMGHGGAWRWKRGTCLRSGLA